MKKALILLLTLATVPALGAERFYDREFPVEPGGRFTLGSFKGSISVRTDDVPSVRLHARIHTDNAGDAALIEHVKIKDRFGPDYVAIEVELEEPKRDLVGLLDVATNWPEVDWEIVLPDRFSLELESHKSRFDVEAPAGSVEIETHKGTGTIKRVRGDFELETHKGDFDVDVLKLGKLEIETHKGDVRLTLHGASDFDLRGRSHKGVLAFNGGPDIPIVKEDDETQVDYRLGSGRNRIELETYKGSITLNFAH